MVLSLSRSDLGSVGGEKASGQAKWEDQREGSDEVGLRVEERQPKGRGSNLAQVPRGEGGAQRSAGGRKPRSWLSSCGPGRKGEDLGLELRACPASSSMEQHPGKGKAAR